MDGPLFPVAPEVEFLILAEAAEAVGGKLYMLGGAFDRLSVVDFAQDVSFHLAVAVLVPWSATNVLHQLTVTIEGEDGARIVEINGTVNVGRPPIALPGQSFRTILTVQIRTKLPGPGAYAIIGSIEGSQPRRTVLYAVPAS